MQIDALRTLFAAHGAKSDHIRLALRAWTRGLALDACRRHPERWFPGSFRAAMPELAATLAALARVRSAHPAADGSERLLVDLADGQTIESVLLPRDGLCVSSQVGCAVGCTFCMTGRGGLLRQLTSGEIVAQVVAARARRPVRKVVFMGMGEPSHNLENVLDAITLLATEGDVAHKNLVLSTVGDPRLFARLESLGPSDVKPALAVSLHTTRDDLRAELLPRAPRVPVATLVDAAETYARSSGYPIQYQWTLIAGVNDGDAEIDALARLLDGKYGVMNFIPYNRIEGSDYERPSNERLLTIARTLHARGILTTLRQSAGKDVEGACGQLRARAARAPTAVNSPGN